MLKRNFILCVLLFLSVFCAFATHNRAGEITYKRIPPFSEVKGGITVPRYTYLITVTKYTKHGDSGVADRCVDTVYFGDEERGIAPRTNGFPPAVDQCGCGKFNNMQVGCGEVILRSKECDNCEEYVVKLSTYTITHTYPGPGQYYIRSYDPNRNQGVINIPNSVNQPFYIESLLIINSFSGSNSSPLFHFAPIDRGCVNECFEHNPGAHDPDNDSLSYEITQSRKGHNEPVPNYSYPDHGPGGNYGIDARTGLLSWCDPQMSGEYNLAFIVKEWRKNTSGDYILIGYVLRDMQVIIANCEEMKPPKIEVPPDTCVEAGTLLEKTIYVSDPNGDYVTVEGGGGPFDALAPRATIDKSGGQTFTHTPKGFAVKFSWQTTCEHIRQQEYQATFKASDNSVPVKLVTFRTYIIKVVPPAVKNVTAVPLGSTIRVTWDAVVCSPKANPITYYKIFRKVGCEAGVPVPCQTGVSVAGFVLSGTVAAGTHTFVDDNNSQGLVVGEDYSYVVVAHYYDGTETFASSSVCAQLRRDVPVILNVDVTATSATAGIIWVRWARPLTTKGNFDTTANAGPYKYNVYHRSAGGTGSTLVHTITGDRLYKLDTFYTHSGINTTAGMEEYYIQFVAGTVTVGSSQKATSVFLKATPADRRIDLEWQQETPWKNTEYTVFRKDVNGIFQAIGTTTVSNYTDNIQVENGSTYCYKVLSKGEYSDPQIFKPLLNNSQEVCETAVDKTPPATPTLALEADCPEGYVYVQWDMKDKSYPNDDVIKFYLFHKSTIDGEYIQVEHGNVNSKEFVGLKEVSGCYAVQAEDLNGNKSQFSPDLCIDNCPAFELPNLFTPNGDGPNDFFKAIIVRQIKEISLTIIDRWGAVIYRTADPYFQWNGVSQLSKKPADEGTYFYICDVFEPRLKGVVKRTIKGYVHLAR
jgi:gliding motility-associated-like protein